jgi:hypothetical protein
MVAPHANEDPAIHLGKARKVAIIDHHGGLGPWGYAEQIVPVPRDSDASSARQNGTAARSHHPPAARRRRPISSATAPAPPRSFCLKPR